ncbi:GlxA family transcriptional regulator [Bradyrhizobium sp. TZ2]
MRKIVVVAFDGVVPFDLSMPCEVFGRASISTVDRPYQVSVCANSLSVRAESFDIRVRHGLEEMEGAHTIIVPGIADTSLRAPKALIRALDGAAQKGVRIASICTGAFILAEAGLLDGRRATTHWLATADLASRFPSVIVDPGILYVDSGQILTSAGAASGLDLCLHLIRKDFGSVVAADAARLAVMPLERSGNQAQLIIHEAPSSADTLQPLLDWLLNNLHKHMDIATIAGAAGMSTRTLIRRFRQQTGTTPRQWLLVNRIKFAQRLLETTALSVEQIVGKVGFDSASSFRSRFQRTVGINPTAYRRAFRSQREVQFRAPFDRGSSVDKHLTTT